MRFCNLCDEPLWPEAPESMATKGKRTYCNEAHEKRDRLIRRRESRATPRWTHECSECNRPMFAPAWESGWYCPECDRTEEIGTSYWEWWKQENHIGGNGSWHFEPSCPECGYNYTYLFDGSLQCHNEDCDLWISQYGREWWAWLETEFPNKDNELMEQTKLES